MMKSMRISHEAIYQALYVERRGALGRELVACLRSGRALRVPRARARQTAWAHLTAEVMISERPAEVEHRAVPGHWDRDLVIGLKRSAIGTLVERTTRFTMLIHLPREHGYGVVPRTKNGPALAGYGAITMKNALASTMTTLPEQLRRSVTWDRDKELSAHAAFTVDTDIAVCFADPKSPSQRGTNENTNGLLRQYFPNRTDLTRWTSEEIDAVAAHHQHPATQDPRMEDPSRSPRRTPTPATTNRCCDHRLSPANSRRCDSPNASTRSAPGPASAPSPIPMTTHWPPRPTVSTRPNAPTDPTHDGWHDTDQLELATLGWVHWFNQQRLHGHCNDTPPAEFEAAFYAARQDHPNRGWKTKPMSLQQSQSGSGDYSGRARLAFGSRLAEDSCKQPSPQYRSRTRTWASPRHSPSPKLWISDAR